MNNMYMNAIVMILLIGYVNASLLSLKPLIYSSSDYLSKIKNSNVITNDITSYMNLRASSPSKSKDKNKNKNKNNDQFAVWHYTGVIKNPVSGLDMVSIEGLEITKNNGIKKNETHICSEYITKKVFIYTDKINNTKAITEFRINPTARKRKVNPVKIMTEKIMIEAQYNDYNNTTDKNLYNCIIEWPRGRKISTKKITISSNNNDRTIIDKILNRGLQYNIVNSMNARKRPLINRWISFSSSGNSDSGKTNEYYTFSNDNIAVSSGKKYNSKVKPLSFMLYKRYGESPSWLALGRLLTTEIIGYKYSSLKFAPYQTVKLIQDSCPEFFKSFYESDVEIYGDVWFNKQHDAYTDFKPFYKLILRKKDKKI